MSRYSHEWYLQNKEKVNKANREWYRRNKAHVLARQHARWLDPVTRKIKQIGNKKWRENNKVKLGVDGRKYQRQRYLEVVAKLGSVCGRCGFEDIRALQIHHKHSKTKKHRRDFISRNYDLTKVELICANCHAIEHTNERHTFNLKYK